MKFFVIGALAGISSAFNQFSQ
jgi:hypothetical protein